MTQQTSGHPPFPPDRPTGPSTTQAARDEAADVGRSADGAGQQVAGTAAEQAGEVAHEVRRQAKDLLGQARQQATDQARNGQQQAADGLRTVASELHQLADGGEHHGPASDLAKQAADRLGDAAEWLGRREPSDLVDELRGLARRRPGAFLVGAALAGVLVGRLTRGAVDAAHDDDDRGPDPVTAPIAAAPGYPGRPPAPMPYDQPGAAHLPPGGPLGGPGGPPPAPGRYGPPPTPAPYHPAPMPPVAPGPGQVGPGPAGYPGERFAPPSPGPAPTTPVAPYDPPAHAPRPGSNTVGEYVDDLDRGRAPQHEAGPYEGGQR